MGLTLGQLAVRFGCELRGNPDVEVRMEGTSPERICAVAMLENDRGNLRITRENLYFKGAQDMDRHYRFDLQWTAGRK